MLSNEERPVVRDRAQHIANQCAPIKPSREP